MLYPQNGDRFVIIDSVTSLHLLYTMYPYSACNVARYVICVCVWLNLSGYRLWQTHVGPRSRVTLALTREYDQIIRSRRRCVLLSNYFDHLLLLLFLCSSYCRDVILGVGFLYWTCVTLG